MGIVGMVGCFVLVCFRNLVIGVHALCVSSSQNSYLF